MQVLGHDLSQPLCVVSYMPIRIRRLSTWVAIVSWIGGLITLGWLALRNRHLKDSATK